MDPQTSASMPEGEITLFDLVSNYYKVMFKDRNKEVFTYNKVRKYENQNNYTLPERLCNMYSNRSIY